MTTTEIPKKGLAGLKAHFKDDLISGFSVSLIALPLCLGIAIASGVPPLAGLITAIVGGIIGSRFAGSFVTISGPAAGLIVITLGAAESMGGAGAASGYAGYPHALGAILIGGAIMALFGVLKVGKVGDFFPSAAVHGMLAAIGVIIIIKQLFPALGVPSPKGEILEVATEIPHAFLEMNYYPAIIALVTLVILIVHPMLKSRLIKMIPAPMWVLIATIPLAAVMGKEHLDLVVMPHNLLGEGGIQFPSFAKIAEGAFWVAVVGVALVSAIESLLSAKAVDALDPYKRKSDLDRDLLAMGAGSSLAAAIGGLPMISEIVRSSANTNNGAKTQWANFFHGSFLLVFLLVGTVVIEMIPISALAAMLVYTGFKLASPKEFRHMYKIGLMELEIFIVTLIAVLATDLIIGIAVGILFKYALLLFKGVPFGALFKTHCETTINDDTATLALSESLIFSNYLSLKNKMDKAIKNSRVLDLDFSRVGLIDHTVMEHLEEYERDLKQEGKALHFINIDALNPVSNHPLAARDRNAQKRVAYEHLQERQIQLFDWATHHNHHFQNKTADVSNWEFYNLTIRKEIKAIENLVNIQDNNVRYTLADISTQEGAEITTDTESITAVKIELNLSLPKFYLQRETWVDKIAEMVGSKDIDFENHPEFSKLFLLKSPDNVEDVKSFFTEELLVFFENHPDCFLISNGTDLLMHKQEKLLNIDEIDLLIAEVRALVSAINVRSNAILA